MTWFENSHGKNWPIGDGRISATAALPVAASDWTVRQGNPSLPATVECRPQSAAVVQPILLLGLGPIMKQ